MRFGSLIRVWFRVWQFQALGFGSFRVLGLGSRVSGFAFRVLVFWGFDFGVSGFRDA